MIFEHATCDSDNFGIVTSCAFQFEIKQSIVGGEIIQQLL